MKDQCNRCISAGGGDCATCEPGKESKEQAQRHCDHECVCMGYCQTCAVENSDPCTRYDCKHDSRPHAPAAIEKITAQKRGCLTCCNPECTIWLTADQNCWQSQEERDDQVKAEERDGVLDKLWYRMRQYFDGDPAVESCYINVADLASEIISLRKGEP